jgi:hypothetical protein
MRKQPHGKDGRFVASPLTEQVLDLWCAQTPTTEIRAATGLTSVQIKNMVQDARKRSDPRAVNRRTHPLPASDRAAQRVLDAILTFQAQHGRAPRWKEIVHGLGQRAHGGTCVRGMQKLREARRIRLLYVIEEARP